MYIKSIVLDGFKSYGNRVEITGFDPEFNAVTGLNGTGKSNILDSICFVLGITNLSNVRAGSLQELIYKHGQAGITKATVSITFDNTDKKQCPIGYEGHDEITVTRQVVMGGKNKYLINGLNVQNKRVSDLFCGVQLNVNNPHFLIMQGRITKVLNMKPPEILAMVEEAAGTRMYEAKKQAAQKTIEKKDAKLRELNDIIKEDIAPKLQKLQDERSQFQEYQKVVRELENLTRLYIAWKYVTAQESTTEAESKVTQVRDEIQKKRDKIETNKVDAKQIDVQVAELNKRLDEESGNTLKQLEAELTTLEKCEATAAANQKALKEAAASSDKRTRLLDKTLRDDEQALAAKNKVLTEVSAQFLALRAASESGDAALAAARAHYLAVSAGTEGAADTLQDRLMAAKAEASEASTQITQSTMERKHCQQRADKLEKEFKSSSQHFEQDQQRIQHCQQQLQTIQSELTKINFREEENETLAVRARSLAALARRARARAERPAARLQRCAVHYSDPAPGFDRRKVPGTVCQLITPVDPVYCTALETAAGGKLYNLIVDTEVTSKLILERGNLQTRTTIIPLNKISGRPVDARTVRLAQDIGGGPDNVQLALDLVTFDEKLRPAMSWVFGQTLVCRDLETARKVTFHPQVRRRCVTLEGDVFDPSGTLSGGARASGASILVELQKLKESESELNSLVSELAECEAMLQANTQAADQYAQLKNKYDITGHELELMKQRAASTSHAQLHEEIQALRRQVLQHEQLVLDGRSRLQEANARAADLEAKLDDIKGHREREFKKAEEALKKAQKAAEEHSSSWKKREQEFETLRLEVQELEKAVSSSKEQLEGTKSSCGELKLQLEKASQEYNVANSAVKEMQSRIKKQKSAIAGQSSEISALQQTKEQLIKNNNELQLKITELEYQVKELQTEANECAERIASLEREHGWIPEERQYFGRAGGVYDWAARPGAVGAARRHQLKERRDRLARGLNARAHTLLANEEEQYQDVMRKKKIVEADRAKLVQVMSELDEKKKRTLVTACEQVNKDFGSIFSSLLPGAQASLAPPPGLSVLDGLEVRVGFNNTWKESLGELSGGQRSLVALALVLAMLLFKPAPLYILDEVDAALDLSHTQNISAMLRDHFTHSQFIVVSLKDGMFNNANVLFRTKFVDGMSTVQRTVNNRRLPILYD